jgi:hypothetical protein
MYTELRWKKFLERLRRWEGNIEVDIRETDERWVEWAEVNTNQIQAIMMSILLLLHLFL